MEDKIILKILYVLITISIIISLVSLYHNIVIRYNHIASVIDSISITIGSAVLIKYYNIVWKK